MPAVWTHLQLRREIVLLRRQDLHFLQGLGLLHLAAHARLRLHRARAALAGLDAGHSDSGGRSWLFLALPEGARLAPWTTMADWASGPTVDPQGAGGRAGADPQNSESDHRCMPRDNIMLLSLPALRVVCLALHCSYSAHSPRTFACRRQACSHENSAACTALSSSTISLLHCTNKM